MKRWLIVIIVLLLSSFLSAAAQEPGGIWLPLIMGGSGEMTCAPFQILEVTDGITTVNLLSPKSGFCLLDWQPAVTEPKGGGVWRDSQLADGRWPVQFTRANVQETYLLAVRNWTPDDLIRDTQELRRLLEKARTYSTDKWQDEPVWIKRQGMIEAAPTYSIVKDYRTPQDGNPHGSDAFWTALGNAAFDNFTLIVEREPWWRGDEPGTGTCAEASGQQVDWEYETWAIVTAAPAVAVNDIVETNAGTLLACEGGNIWRSVNGTVWVVAVTNPPGAVGVQAMAVVGNTIYATGWDGGTGHTWSSTDDGLNWATTNANIGGGEPNSMVYRPEDGYLYVVDALAGNAYRSTDGIVWAAILPFTSGGGVVGRANDGTLYIGDAYRLYRSTDGTTWDLVSTFYGSGYNVSGIKEVGAVGDVTLLAFLFNAGVPAGAVQRSTDGIIWTEVIPGTVLTNAIAQVRDAIRTDRGVIYLTFSPAAPNVDLYVSLDGKEWLPDENILAANEGFYSLLQWSSDRRIYGGEIGDIWRSPAFTTVGRAATCDDETYLANKANVAQLTHVKVYDASAAPPADYTDQFPAAFPFDLLPNPLVNGDAVVLSIDTTVADSGPFCSAVFDIERVALGTFTLTWYYPSGGGAVFPPPGAGWTVLNVQDGTSSFQLSGVHSIHWVPPSDWAQIAIDGVTGYHVVCLVGGAAANPVGPRQDNRDVYTINWPRVDVDDAQVLGDIPALLQGKFRNRSDEDGYENIDELDLLENRVIVGRRSLSRGENFIAYLNCSDEQNPVGVEAADGAATSDVNDIDHPTGRSMQHTTTGLSTWTDECTFTLSPVIAQSFYGSFHVYFRGQQVDRDSVMDEVRVRLQVRTGSGGVTFTTEHKPFRNLNDWQLLDFGGLDLPASGLLSSDDLPDEMEIVVQIWSSVASKYVNLYDLVLIPTDEWAQDLVDKALEDDSGVTNGHLLDVDSVTYPKRDIRALVRDAGNELVRSIYQPNGPSPATLRANQDQRLWFLTARGCVLGSHTGANNQTTLTDSAASFLTSGVETGQYIFNVTDGSSGFVGATVTATTITDCGLTGGTDNDWDTNDEYLIVCPNWRSEPWNAHSVQLVNVARYLSMKGAR